MIQSEISLLAVKFLLESENVEHFLSKPAFLPQNVWARLGLGSAQLRSQLEIFLRKSGFKNHTEKLTENGRNWLIRICPCLYVVEGSIEVSRPEHCFFMPWGFNRKSSYHNNRLEAKFESCLRLIYSTHFTHVVQRPPQSQSDQTKQLLEKGGKKKQGRPGQGRHTGETSQVSISQIVND